MSRIGDELAVERTRLAHERTLLAYIRTGLAIVAGGFAILQFIRGSSAGWIGIALIATGVATLSVGAIRYLRAQRRLDRAEQMIDEEI